MKNKEIVPSLLSFDKNNWFKYFVIFKNNNINYIHFDVMDKEYVGNLAYNEVDYKMFLENNNGLKSHVHLMVIDPLNEIEKYNHSLTDAMCFHFDVYNDERVFDCLNKIELMGIKPGIAINPSFKFNDYEKYLKKCKFITIMGVYPGKGGQKFEFSCLDNLINIRDYCIKNNCDLLIEIDGGMNFETIPLVIDKSKYIVSGSFLFNNLDKIDNVINWFNNLK